MRVECDGKSASAVWWKESPPDAQLANIALKDGTTLSFFHMKDGGI